MSVSFFLTLCGNAAVGLAFISDKRFISTKAVWAFSAHTIFGTAWKVLVYIVMIYSVDMIHFWQRIAWLMASTSISVRSARSLPSLTIWIRFYGKINNLSSVYSDLCVFFDFIRSGSSRECECICTAVRCRKNRYAFSFFGRCHLVNFHLDSFLLHYVGRAREIRQVAMPKFSLSLGVRTTTYFFNGFL